jgi:hypothetical protein
MGCHWASLNSTAFRGNESFAVLFLLLFGDDLPMPRLVPELALEKDQTNDKPPPAADSWSSRKKTINIMGGSPGGPMGYGGLSFEYAPIPWVVLGAGAGATGDGVRGAFMPRLRLPINRHFAVGLGFPLSAGPYEAIEQVPERCSLPGCPVGYRTSRTWEVAWWMHLEPNVEFRVGGGMALRLYGGQSYLINRNDDQCKSTLQGGCPSRIGERQWYGGLALGYAW